LQISHFLWISSNDITAAEERRHPPPMLLWHDGDEAVVPAAGLKLAAQTLGQLGADTSDLITQINKANEKVPVRNGTIHFFTYKLPVPGKH
jgi:hypothetical protein